MNAHGHHFPHLISAPRLSKLARARARVCVCVYIYIKAFSSYW